MFSRSVAVAALLLVPSFADAQRKTRGDKEADWNSIDKSVQAGPKISKKDLESFSAIKVIVDKRKDLKLSDDQLTQFKDLDKKEEGTNQCLYDQVDSLRMAMRKRPGDDPDQERARTTLAQQELMTVIRQIRANYDESFQASLPLLDETQKAAATQLVQKEQADAEEDLRSKIGSGGMRSGGGGSTRKRP